MDKKSLILAIAKVAAEIGGTALAAQGHAKAANLVEVAAAGADKIAGLLGDLAPHATDGALAAADVHAHYQAARQEAQALVAEALAGNAALDADAGAEAPKGADGE